jgi:hypothetical protein
MSIYGPRLAKLYAQGSLKNVLKLMGDKFNEKYFIGHGDDASCFDYTNQCVLKLCTKEIKYFKNTKHASAVSFFKISSSLDSPRPSVLLPIKELLYEDEYVFVYTQPKCDRLKSSQINTLFLNEIIQVEYTLLKHRLQASTSTHNLGLYKDHIVIFDYHDLRPLVIKESWCQRIINHLMQHIQSCYECKCDSLRATLKNNKIPKHYRELLCFLEYGPLDYKYFINAYDNFFKKLNN